MAVNRDTRRNTVLNFPQQAACAEIMRLTLILAVEGGLGPTLCAPHHDAFYLECHEGEVERVSAALNSCFREAVGVVLSGRVHLRLDSGIVRYPDHYHDEDGAEIWGIVRRFLAVRNTTPRCGSGLQMIVGSLSPTRGTQVSAHEA